MNKSGEFYLKCKERFGYIFKFQADRSVETEISIVFFLRRVF